MLAGLFERAEAAAAYVRERTRVLPEIAIILGSGLGGFAEELEDRTEIPYADIPGFPRSSTLGHAGKLVVGETAGQAVLTMQGRVHYYEGLSLAEVTFPVRVLGRLGVRALVLTNAAGGLNTEMVPGSLMIICDHLNLQGSNPLIGENDARFGPRFPDMATVYDEHYRTIAVAEGRRLGIPARQGVYAALHGPSFETAAEIRMLRMLGADAVGMSTVPEVIVASHMGMKCLAISCITNVHGGLTSERLSHEEVLEVGERVRVQFVELIRRLLPLLAQDLRGR